MNLGYTLQQKNHKALLMMDYYKQKIEIYMTPDIHLALQWLQLNKSAQNENNHQQIWNRPKKSFWGWLTPQQNI